MNLNYKSYWRKTGLKGKWGNIFLNKLEQHNPKNVLEIGVFCGVTARNICDFLHKKNIDNFSYIGIDLFGSTQNEKKNEIEPTFLKDQKFSNPLKNIYYNHILKENLNSIKSVKKLLKKIKQKLIKNQKNEPILSRERHLNIMKKVLLELKSIKEKDSLDIIAFKLREALTISLEINQKFDIEGVLDIIFKDFCIGK